MKNFVSIVNADPTNSVYFVGFSDSFLYQHLEDGASHDPIYIDEKGNETILPMG